jgi:hypothetical protein
MEVDGLHRHLQRKVDVGLLSEHERLVDEQPVRVECQSARVAQERGQVFGGTRRVPGVRREVLAARRNRPGVARIQLAATLALYCAWAVILDIATHGGRRDSRSWAWRRSSLPAHSRSAVCGPPIAAELAIRRSPCRGCLSRDWLRPELEEQGIRTATVI